MLGGGASPGVASHLKASSKDGSASVAAPGVDFSDEKRGAAPFSVGEGILPPERTPPKETTTAHLDKANSLLDELSREERSGYKAEIGTRDMKSKVDAIANDPSPGSELQQNRDSGGNKSSKQDPVKRTASELEDNYDEDFEDEIDEDLPADDLDVDVSGVMPGVPKIGDSHGITVSQSLGIDPSVDSLALEDYDLIEPVDRINN